MIEVTLFRDVKIGVFGLGRSGRAAIYSLTSGGAKVVAWDDDEKKRKAIIDESKPENTLLNFEDVLVDLDSKKWQGIKYLILSPGIPLNYPKPHKVVELARKNNCPIICDIELLHKTCSRAKYIGITGTNGKSTTTALIGHILKNAGKRVEVGGNIGIAALDLQPLATDGTYVLELSSFQLELLDKTQLNIAILLNITQDHLDRHGDMENYIEAKSRIFSNQGPDDVAIIGIDNQLNYQIYQKLLSQGRIGTIIPISNSKRIEGGISVINDIIYNDTKLGDEQLREIKFEDLPHLRGKHNHENMAAAFATALVNKMTLSDIMAGIKSFQALPHRMQLVEQINSVTFINDSKATNVESASKALATFDNIYWIAGGVAKAGSTIADLADYFPRINHAFLIGKAEDEFSEALAKENVAFTKCNNLENAIKLAAKMALEANQDSVVLLCPACASYDQWLNFEERGLAFISLVKEFKSDCQS